MDTPRVVVLRRRMNLAYQCKKINSLVLLDTDAEVSCLRHSVFEEFRLPYSVLKAMDTTISAANGSPLETLGTLNLKAVCYCYKQKCQGLRVISFHVMKDLAEHALILNADCQWLGLITMSTNNQTRPKVKTVIEHPSSFNILINNLSISLPEISSKTVHVCSKDNQEG